MNAKTNVGTNGIHVARNVAQAQPVRPAKIRAGAVFLESALGEISVARPSDDAQRHVFVGWTGVHTLPNLHHGLYNPSDFALDVAHWARRPDGTRQFRVGRFHSAFIKSRLVLVLASVYDAADRCDGQTQPWQVTASHHRGTARFAVLAAHCLESVQQRATAQPTFAVPMAMYRAPAGFDMDAMFVEHQGHRYAPQAEFRSVAPLPGPMIAVQGIRGRVIPNPAFHCWDGVTIDRTPAVLVNGARRMAWLDGTLDDADIDEVRRRSAVLDRFEEMSAVFANTGSACEPDLVVADNLAEWVKVPALPAVGMVKLVKYPNRENARFAIAPWGEVNLHLPDPRAWRKPNA